MVKEKYKKRKDSKSTRVDDRFNKINNIGSSQSNPRDLERIDQFFRFHKKHIWKDRRKK